MATTLLYARPDEIKTYPLVSGTMGSVSSSSVDAAYFADSLIAGWPGTPTRWTVSNPSGTVTLPAAGAIDLVVVSHHKLVAGTTITFGSGITVVVTVPTWPTDGIPRNPYNTLTSVPGVTGFAFTVAGNTGDAIIGEILAASSRSLTLPFYTDDKRGQTDFAREMPTEQSSVPPYRRGLAARAPWKGRYVLTTAQRDEVDAWFLSQCEGTRPSIVIPDTTVNDAWVGFLQAPQYSVATPRHWNVELTFIEFPRTRW